MSKIAVVYWSGTGLSLIHILIASGRIGDVVSICANENVGYWHQAHSFVRGNWRNSQQTSPMILQKSCHDTVSYTHLDVYKRQG